MALWFAIGIPAYIAACIGIGKFMHAGMGSDAETVIEVWDAAKRRLADADARGDTRGKHNAEQAVKAAMTARLKAGL